MSEKENTMEKSEIEKGCPFDEPNAFNTSPKKEFVNSELHPDTQILLDTCFAELKAKLIRNQEKYGYSNHWLHNEWEKECREDMMTHIKKGDPRDVAIYAMFMMYRGWSTKSESSEPDLLGKLKEAILMNILEDNYELNTQFHKEAREMIYSFATAIYDEKLTFDEWHKKHYSNQKL